MTTPPNGSGPTEFNFDQVHEVPAEIATAVVPTTHGQRLALVVRIPNGSVTVLLRKDAALRWADQIRADVAKMNGLIIPPGVG